jgi:hypothetical protein
VDTVINLRNLLTPWQTIFLQLLYLFMFLTEIQGLLLSPSSATCLLKVSLRSSSTLIQCLDTSEKGSIVPYFVMLGNDLSPWRHGFDSNMIHVGFLGYKSQWTYSFTQIFPFKSSRHRYFLSISDMNSCYITTTLDHSCEGFRCESQVSLPLCSSTMN